jgi:hypothetical protein
MAAKRQGTGKALDWHGRAVGIGGWKLADHWLPACACSPGGTVPGAKKAFGAHRPILVFLAATLLAAVPVSSAALFQQRHIDMDTLIEGDSALASFTFVNSLEQTVTLEQVHTSCGCVVAAGADKTYPPGEKGTLNLDFSSSGLRGEVASEAVAVFRLHGDSAALDSIVDTVAFTAYIKNELRFIPPSIAGMHTDTSGSFTAHGELLNSTDTTVRLVSLAVESGEGMEVLTRQLPREVSPGDKVPFTVLMQPNTKGDTTGAVRGRVAAHVENTKYERHYCDIRIFVE